jgi:hypothetical protein
MRVMCVCDVTRHVSRRAVVAEYLYMSIQSVVHMHSRHTRSHFPATQA